MHIVSWNVRGAMSSTICLSNLLDDTQCDIAIVSEHKLKDIHTAKMYLDSIHKNYFSIVNVDNNTDRTTNNVCFINMGGVALLIKNHLMYSVTEIPCFDSNRVSSVEVKTSGGNLYIFGVYMHADNNIDAYMYELNTLESLYNFFSTYVDVQIAGDLNSSCISRNHTNAMKAQALTAFITRCCICIRSIPNAQC